MADALAGCNSKLFQHECMGQAWIEAWSLNRSCICSYNHSNQWSSKTNPILELKAACKLTQRTRLYLPKISLFSRSVYLLISAKYPFTYKCLRKTNDTWKTEMNANQKQRATCHRTYANADYFPTTGKYFKKQLETKLICTNINPTFSINYWCFARIQKESKCICLYPGLYVNQNAARNRFKLFCCFVMIFTFIH